MCLPFHGHWGLEGMPGRRTEPLSGSPPHSTSCGAFLLKLLTIIDQICTILLVLAQQSLTCFDMRAENMLAASLGAVNAKNHINHKGQTALH